MRLETINLDEDDLSAVIDYLCQTGKRTEIFYLWRPFLSDAEDDMVLELAVAGGCGSIITFNGKDFNGVEEAFGIKILTPRQFLVELGEMK